MAKGTHIAAPNMQERHFKCMGHRNQAVALATDAFVEQEAFLIIEAVLFADSSPFAITLPVAMASVTTSASRKVACNVTQRDWKQGVPVQLSLIHI